MSCLYLCSTCRSTIKYIKWCSEKNSKFGMQNKPKNIKNHIISFSTKAFINISCHLKLGILILANKCFFVNNKWTNFERWKVSWRERESSKERDTDTCWWSVEHCVTGLHQLSLIIHCSIQFSTLGALKLSFLFESAVQSSKWTCLKVEKIVSVEKYRE